MVRIKLFHQFLTAGQTVDHAGGQFVVDVPSEQGGMVFELIDLLLDVGGFGFLRCDRLRAPRRAVVRVFDGIDDFQAAFVDFVQHRGVVRRSIWHQRVERRFRVQIKIFFVHAAPVHAQREERLAVDDQTLVFINVVLSFRKLRDFFEPTFARAFMRSVLQREVRHHAILAELQIGGVDGGRAIRFGDFLRSDFLDKIAVGVIDVEAAAHVGGLAFPCGDIQADAEFDRAFRHEPAVQVVRHKAHERRVVAMAGHVVKPRLARHAFADIDDNMRARGACGNLPP